MLNITATELPRFMACNGSRLLGGAMPPNDDTEARNEGNAAHYMAMQVLQQKSTIEELIDRKAPNGVYMGSDMAEHVMTFIDGVKRSYFQPLENEVETTFSDNVNWKVNARSDVIGYADTSTLHIDDFKYGWRIVEPEMNWTLIAHAIGYCFHRKLLPAHIVFTVHQPRPYHPDGPTRSWRVNYQELMDLYHELNFALCNPSDTLNTSAHCAKCHALAICPAARAAELNAIDTSDVAFEDTIDNVTLSQTLENLYRAEAMLKARKDAFEDLAKHRIKAGEVINNYSVEMTLSNSRWLPGIDASMMTILTGKELSKSKIASPAEAKRLGVNEAVIKALTERVPTGVKLVRGKADAKAKRLFNNEG